MEFLDEARFKLEHFPEEWGHAGESDVKEGFVLTFTWNELINNGEAEQREASRDITRVVHVGVPVVQDASHVSCQGQWYAILLCPRSRGLA